MIRLLCRAPGIIFMNTIYFKRTWKKPFNKSLTVPRPFHAINNHTVDVPTMYTLGRFKHGRIDAYKAQFVEFLYASNDKSDTMSMFIILPDDCVYNVWSPLIPALEPETLMEKFSNSTEKDVEVYLPQFRIETDLRLDSIIGWFFHSWFRASLIAKDSRVLDPSISLNVTKTKTKVVIEVDESGQETAGSTGVFYNTTEPATSDRKTRSVPQGVTQFKVDHYFVAVCIVKGKIHTEAFYFHSTGRIDTSGLLKSFKILDTKPPILWIKILDRTKKYLEWLIEVTRLSSD
ncbi:serine protease inhibitor 3/4-like [Venturia canescens]|uniref:serine protease inhibitor 3/4-like n=1 Tax=Venturia canescens TaxID=32260 RepID=UPI001C9D53E7|nr:serine protease inhibitor 3/4-like [Venturia canescens]